MCPPHILIALVLTRKRLPHYSSHGLLAARTAGEGGPKSLNLPMHRLGVTLEIRAPVEDEFGAAFGPDANPLVWLC